MKNIKKQYKIKALKEDVFTALSNPLSIEMWSGEPAIMTLEEGSEFSLWDGNITGKNLKIDSPNSIQQQWYFEGEEEQSIVTLNLLQEGAYTTVNLLHINIPDEAFDNIIDGWDNYYMKPLKQLVEE